MTAQPPPLPGSAAADPSPSRGTVTAPDGGGDVLLGPAGWYRHPDGDERWWDGIAWADIGRDGKVPPHVAAANEKAAAEERRWARTRKRIILGFVAVLVLWVVGGAAWKTMVERVPALERTTPTVRAAAVLNAPRGLATGDACPTTDKQLVDPASAEVARWRELRGCDLVAPLDRAGWEWVTRPTEDSPTAVVDYTFAEVKDAKHPDATLGGTTVRLTLTLEKVFLGWKVATVGGLPARAQG